MLPLDHYTKQTNRFGSEQDYFSYSGGESGQLSVQAVRSNGRDYDHSETVSGGTNIHVGVDAGMDILKAAEPTTAVLEDGTTVNRVPALILLSDGSPTYSGSDNSNWWDPSGYSSTGYSASQDGYNQGNAAYSKFVMKTIMNAAYNKQQVDAHYNATGNYATRVYTVGVGMDDLQQGTERNSARLTLNQHHIHQRSTAVAELSAKPASPS